MAFRGLVTAAIVKRNRELPTTSDEISLAEAAEIGITVRGPFPCASGVPAWRRWSSLPYCLFLDSAARHDAHFGRYSFLAAEPFAMMRSSSPTAGESWDYLDRTLRAYRTPRIRDLPPFQAGLAGLLSYELAGTLEAVPRAAVDEFQLPATALFAYDTVLAIDHWQDAAWIVSQGFPEVDLAARGERSRRRADYFEKLFVRAELPASEGPFHPVDCYEVDRHVDASIDLAAGQLIAHPLMDRGHSVFSNFSQDAYLAMIRRAVEYIYDGDLFQVNLAQRLLAPKLLSPVEFYERLRTRNPAPFAAYLDLGDEQILSASPERFLRLQGDLVETRPIKGTRRRVRSPEVDLFTADDLRASEKDVAENIMIVDLLRNDLSRVCLDDSVRVQQLCGVENYQFVQHLVSVIHGQLSPTSTAVDLVRATFPGGSITGAPKVRAMEIIAELEPTVRGPYCGSLAYFGFDGSMDSNILIRTVTSARGWWQFPVGGGIVAQSDPLHEYQETWHKAAGILQSVSMK